MAGEIKNLVKHGSVYTMGTILSRVISFLMIPIYTNYLVPAEYGTLELLSMTVDVISTIIGIGMTATIMRFYYKYDNEDDKKRAASTALIGTMTLMSLASATSLLFASSLSQAVFKSPDYAPHFRVIFITMFLSSGIEIPMVLLRAKLRSVNYVVISLTKMVMQLSLNIYFLVVLDLGVFGVLYSTLIVNAIVCAYLTISTFRETGIKFSSTIYREMLKFGAPLIIADLSIFILTYADRYFLNYYCDLTTVGVYSLAYKFGMLVSLLFGGPFYGIWGASMFEYAKKENGKEVFASVMNYFLMGALAISLFFSLFTKDLLRIMANPEYWSAYKIVPLIGSSYVISGTISICGAGIMICNKTKYKALSTTAGMVVNTVLNFLLIPHWGAYGAGISTLVSFAVRMAVDNHYSQKLFRITYETLKITKMIVIYAVLSSASYLINIENIVASILVYTLVMLAFPVVLYYTGVITEDNRDLFFSILKNPIEHIKNIRSQSE